MSIFLISIVVLLCFVMYTSFAVVYNVYPLPSCKFGALALCLQAASIQKAINSQECATKEKHARGILCDMSVMYCFQSELCCECAV